MITMGIFASIICILLAALLTGIVFHYLRFPTVLGYLLVGAIAGPYALGVIPNEENITTIAEFGIVFLMFTIGLEFSLPKLIALRNWVLGVGTLQVLIGIIVTTLIGMALGMTPISAFAVGGIVVMSSTAIVLKELSEQREIYSKVGRNAIGVLLAQDLAVVPFIILLESFYSSSANEIFMELGRAVLSIVFVTVVFLFGQQWILKPLFKVVSKTRVLDLFTILVLLVALGTSWLTHWLGLSYALGAFLAGVMLSETEFRHQIEVEIRPFRDMLLGLFFITIGMLVNISAWQSTWYWILLLLVAIVICKIILIIMLCRFAGDDNVTSWRTGLVLAQSGEFGFAILTIALANGQLSEEYGQVVLAALWISIVISPLLIRYNKTIVNFILPKTSQLRERRIEQDVQQLSSEVKNHVILCGYGNVGQHIARVMDLDQVPYVGLELDPVLVHNAKLSGKRVTYGDATHPGILEAAKIGEARAVVVSFSDFPAAMKILGVVKQLKPSLPVLVRCRDEGEIDQLKSHGASRVVAEVFEEGLTLAHHLLEILRLPDRKINMLIHAVRNRDYNLLRGILPGTFSELMEEEGMHLEQLRPVVLQDGAYAIYRTIGELNLNRFNVDVVAIRRGQSEYPKPDSQTHLHMNDILVLFGEEANLEKAELLIQAGES